MLARHSSGTESHTNILSGTVCGFLQVFDNKTTYIFDFVAAATGNYKASKGNIKAMVDALKAVLEDAAVAKIVHDGRQVWQ